MRHTLFFLKGQTSRKIEMRPFPSIKIEIIDIVVALGLKQNKNSCSQVTSSLAMSLKLIIVQPKGIKRRINTLSASGST